MLAVSRPEGSIKGSIPTARWGSCKFSRKEQSALCGAFAEPSDGLEPSTPSLPLSKEGGTEGTGGKPRARRSRKKEESADEE
jgi:hypothetical protein